MLETGRPPRVVSRAPSGGNRVNVKIQIEFNVESDEDELDDKTARGRGKHGGLQLPVGECKVSLGEDHE